MLREAQLLVGYPDSPLVGETGTGLTGGPVPGQRADDAGSLTQAAVGYPVRLHSLLRHPGHTLVLWARGDAALARQADLASAVAAAVPAVRCYVVVDSAVTAEPSGSVLQDGAGAFARAYATAGVDAAAYLIRPDGYVGYRTADPTTERILGQLGRTLRF